jgi:hypothetical protein
MKEKFYAKPFDPGYQKIDMCPNFCMLYYIENTELIECRTCGHAYYKPKTSRKITLVAHRKLIYFLITYKLQRLFMTLKIDKHMT